LHGALVRNPIGMVTIPSGCIQPPHLDRLPEVAIVAYASLRRVGLINRRVNEGREPAHSMN
jgi:hypothetical protein